MKKIQRIMMSFLLIGIAATATATPAAPVERILSFQQWKDQQVIDASNRVARLNNRIALMRLQKANKDQDITKLGVDLRVAMGAVTVVKQLGIEDYFNVYLSQFAPDPGLIQEIAKNLSPKEVAQLLAIYFKSRRQAERPSAGPVQLAAF